MNISLDQTCQAFACYTTRQGLQIRASVAFETTTSEQRAAITKYQGLAVAQAAQFLQNMDDDQNMYVSCRSLMRFRSLDEYWNWNTQSCTLSDGIS